MKSNMVYLMMAVVLLVMSAGAQQTAAGSDSATVVPQLIKFSGVAKSSNGQALTGMVGITFALYQEQQGGAPLWLETQNVQLDVHGNYTVQLGATLGSGVPASLFNTGEARWVGVQIIGQEEQPRVMLLSVPYAMKAGDAQTLAGMPASAFVQANHGGATSAGGSERKNGKAEPDANTITGSGTTNYLPLWTSSSALGNSLLYQSGPNVNLTAGGGIIINGTQDGTGSSLVPNQLFFQDNGEIASHDANHRIIFDRANNIMEFREWGNLVFSPGSSGGRTSTVTVPSGGGITVVGDLREDFNGANKGSYTPGLRFGSGNSGEGISSDRAGAINQYGLDFYTDYLPRMSVTNAGKVGIGTQAPAATLEVNGTAKFDAPVTFTGAQTIDNSLTVTATGQAYAITGTTNNTANSAAGVFGYESAATGAVNGVIGATSSTTTYAAGVFGYEEATTGQVAGVQGNTNSTTNYAAGVNGWEGATTGHVFGVIGNTISTTTGAAGVYGVESASTGQVFGVVGGTGSPTNYSAAIGGWEGATTGQVFGVTGTTVSTTAGAAGVNGADAANGDYGLLGTSITVGSSTQPTGVYGNDTSSGGVGNGVFGNSTTGTGVYGATGSSSNEGVFGYNPSTTSGGAGVGGQSSGGYGVWGVSDTGDGVLGASTWSNGVGGASTNANGGYFVNANEEPALYATTTYTGGEQSLISGVTLSGGNQYGCTIVGYPYGEINCTPNGFHSVVPVDEGQRKVALSAVQSPQSWFEDFGSGQLSSGSAVIRLEPVFAQTVNTEREYHVFLTPNGDCKGLYVAQKSSASFEVHELGGGTSNARFDYRIVALRKGTEDIRLLDRTHLFDHVTTPVNLDAVHLPTKPLPKVPELQAPPVIAPPIIPPPVLPKPVALNVPPKK